MAAPHQAQYSGLTLELNKDIEYLLSTYFVPGPGNTTMNTRATVSAPKKFPNKQTHTTPGLVVISTTKKMQSKGSEI